MRLQAMMTSLAMVIACSGAACIGEAPEDAEEQAALDADPLTSVVEADYTLVSVHSGKLLDIAPGAAPLRQSSDTRQTRQSWRVVGVGGGYYKIVNIQSGSALGVSDPGREGAAAVQSPYTGAQEQQWGFEPAGAGSYVIRNRRSGKALDVFGASRVEGAAVIQWTFHGDPNQRWTLVPTSPERQGISGFAAAGGTTGGDGGEVKLVSSAAELRRWAAGDTPYVIKISEGAVLDLAQGETTRPAWVVGTTFCGANGRWDTRIPADSSTKTPAVVTSGAVNVGSNKTIIGLGSGATLRRGTLNLDGSTNVIIRNLTIQEKNPRLMEEGDGISIDGADRLWIDHVKLRLISDGFIDMYDANHVTISWTELDGRNADWCEDSHSFVSMFIRSQVTLDHNWYHDALGRLPKVVGGTVHLLNGYYSNNNGLGVDLHDGAKVVVERTVYENTRMPHRRDDTSGVSLLGASLYLGSSATTSSASRGTGGATFDPRLSYAYDATDVSANKAAVLGGVGPGKVRFR